MKKPKSYFPWILLIVFIAFSLWIRSLPQSYLITDTAMNVLGNDAWYMLRQIESMVANYPHYNWYDPMTAYPVGKHIDWGPLYPFISSTLCVLLGASTRAEIVSVVSWVPPVVAALMVPIMFQLGKIVDNWRTGLISAGFITVASSMFFVRSLFGFIDHHIAEVLFSTLFCLCYITALHYARRPDFSVRDRSHLSVLVLLAVASGTMLLLGFLNMITIILFAFIAAVFTIVQFVRHHFENESAEYLLLLNVVTFVIPAAGMALMGIQYDRITLATYTVAHVYALVAVIAMSVVLYFLSTLLQGKNKEYLASIIIFGSLSILVASFIKNELVSVLIEGLTGFFGQTTATSTILEMGSFDIGLANSNYYLGLLLMAIGFGVLWLRIKKESKPDHLFILVWSVMLLFSTIAHIRFEYYFVVPFVLLSAIGLEYIVEWGWPEASNWLHKPQNQEEKKPKKSKSKKKRSSDNNPTLGLKSLVFILGISCALIFCGLSIADHYATIYGSQKVYVVSPEWRDTLEWMQDHTPDPGVDYLGLYERDHFTYPAGSYGVMSWWDYGHWITVIAKRIPNTNPFQSNVVGKAGSAPFFMAQSEDTADEILGHAQSRYVIVDNRMANYLFRTIAMWENPEKGISPYLRYFEYTYPDESDPSMVKAYDREFYHTMLIRLHQLDGSMTDVSEALYLEYRDVGGSTGGFPTIVKMDKGEVSSMAQKVAGYGNNGLSETHAVVLSNDRKKPLDTVPALRHYRLIHETPKGSESSTAGLDEVKLFEYVPGARIRGDGVIEATIITNTGREFIYRQESINGEFVVPYTTTGNPYDVGVSGLYHILGTDEMYQVTESDVLSGNYV